MKAAVALAQDARRCNERLHRLLTAHSVRQSGLSTVIPSTYTRPREGQGGSQAPRAGRLAASPH